MDDKDFMRRAIELAKMGGGWVNPNPQVGAVIVKDGKIIGEGYHQRCGELHAERNAFASLKGSAEGATMYVTLEPCCHYGRTPPCTEAIIEHGIRKVVIGSRDPNPLVSGKGARLLRRNGILVQEDFLREECDALNTIFFHYITTGTPYVAVKYAMSMDGKIACANGESKWITGEKARVHVQTLRSRYSAILVGIGTVLADDPMLNCRIEGEHSPFRVVVDSNLRIPLDSQLCKTAKDYPTLVAYAKEDKEKLDALNALGVITVPMPDEDDKKVHLPALMMHLAENRIDSVLIEGGGRIHEAALSSGIVNHVYAYLAPKLIGGELAKTPVEGLGVDSPEDAAILCNRTITPIGDDILLEYDVKRGMQNVHRNR